MTTGGISTLFLLMAEFGAGTVELDKVAEKYLGLTVNGARAKAAMNRLPIPAFRGASQKSPRLISLVDLAAHLDKRMEAARESWRKSQVETTWRDE
jgi:hypothetical protein